MYITSLPTSSQLRAAARAQLSGRWGTSVVTILVFEILSAIVTYATFGLGAIFLAGPLLLGFNIYMMNIQRQQEGTVETLFSGFRLYGHAILLYILQAIFIILWTMLFIIPGLIKTYSYSMAYYIQRDNPHMSALECITESRRMMEGHKLRLFLLQLSFIGWYILGCIPFYIGLLWVIPYFGVAQANFYENLKTHYYNAREDEQNHNAYSTGYQGSYNDQNTYNGQDLFNGQTTYDGQDPFNSNPYDSSGSAPYNPVPGDGSAPPRDPSSH